MDLCLCLSGDVQVCHDGDERSGCGDELLLRDLGEKELEKGREKKKNKKNKDFGTFGS